MTKLKLKSGREVQLQDLAFSQREQCEDAPTIRLHKNGDVEVGNLAVARTLWVKYGLGLEDVEALNEYSSAELDEIMLVVKEKAEAGTPPKAD